jgi:hypothetical protein
MVFWFYCPFDDNLFDIIIKDFLRDTSTILECMFMAFPEGLDIDLDSELDVF